MSNPKNFNGSIKVPLREVAREQTMRGVAPTLAVVDELQAMEEEERYSIAEVPTAPPADVVNHPEHYTAYEGVEVIQLTEQLNFNRGNAIKYIARAGLKSKDTETEDLRKAAWYIQRELDRIGG